MEKKKMTDEEWDERADWVQIGLTRGWISEQYCAVHDGGYAYYTEEEKEQSDEGGDPCEPVFRILTK
jgi:hypothetical protein